MRQAAFWLAFLLNIVFVSRYIPVDVLRLRGARRFFLVALIYVILGFHYRLYDAFLFVEQEYLFFFYGYFNLNFIFEFLAFLVILFPWVFLFSAISVSSINSILPFFSLLTAFLFWNYLPWTGFWLPTVLLLSAFFLNTGLLNSKPEEQMTAQNGRENWLWCVLGLLALLYYKLSILLPVMLAFFLWHNQARYGLFQGFKKFCPEDGFFFLFLYFSVVMVFFGNFSTGASFLLLLFFALFSSSSGNSSGFHDLLAVLFALFLLFFDFLNNETFLLLLCYVMLYIRIFGVFRLRKQFSGLVLCTFLFFYCLAFRRPLLSVVEYNQNKAPVLRELAGMREGRLRGDVYFKSVNVVDDFVLFPAEEKWLLFNYFPLASMSVNAETVFWLQPEMLSHIPGQAYGFGNMKSLQAKKKWRLLLERTVPRNLGFSFHNMGIISEWNEWFSVLSDKKRRVFAVFTKMSYKTHNLSRLLNSFNRNFPGGSVLILRDRVIVFRDLTPVVEKQNGIHLRPVIPLATLLTLLGGRELFSFADLRDRLIAGQVRDIWKSDDLTFGNNEAAVMALELYRQGLKESLGVLLSGLLEFNPLNQDYDYFSCLQKGVPRTHAFYNEFQRWLEKPEIFQPLRSRDYLVDIFRLQAYFSDDLSGKLSFKHLSAQNNDVWFMLLAYLNENNLAEAAKIVQREALIPESRQERMLLHRYYMQNMNARAATFFED